MPQSMAIMRLSIGALIIKYLVFGSTSPMAPYYHVWRMASPHGSTTCRLSQDCEAMGSETNGPIGPRKIKLQEQFDQALPRHINLTNFWHSARSQSSVSRPPGDRQPAASRRLFASDREFFFTHHPTLVLTATAFPYTDPCGQACLIRGCNKSNPFT